MTFLIASWHVFPTQCVCIFRNGFGRRAIARLWLLVSINYNQSVIGNGHSFRSCGSMPRTAVHPTPLGSNPSYLRATTSHLDTALPSVRVESGTCSMGDSLHKLTYTNHNLRTTLFAFSPNLLHGTGDILRGLSPHDLGLTYIELNRLDRHESIP